MEQAPRVERLEQLETEPGRRVRPRPERAARVDDDYEPDFGRRLPRRPDPELPDADGLVEVAPAILPALVDLAHPGAAEGLPEPLLAAGVGVRDQLDAAAAAADLLGAL